MSTQPPDPTLDRLVPIREVASRLGCSVRSIERGVEKGRFPRAEKICGKRVYPESFINSIIENVKRRMSCQS